MVGRYCCNKRMHAMVVELIREGWTFSHGSHNRVTDPNGRVVIFSDTPSDGNAHRQFARDIAKVKAGHAIRPKNVA